MRAHVACSLAALLALSALVVLAAPAAAWEIDDTATVTAVIDGDTFDASPTGRIRLADIDAPEYYETGYQEATDYLSGLIAGQTVYLDIDDVYGTDRYDRWVAVVYVRSDSLHLRNVNQALLDAGMAVVWDFTNEFDPATWASYVFYPVDAPPPTVAASASVTEGFAPLTVAFTSTASGGLPPYTYLWDFQDGGTSTDPNPSHTFSAGGAFSVTLTVTDTALRTGTKTTAITVHSPLSAAASVEPSTGTAPLTVTFAATPSGGIPPYSYVWTFGDGNESTSPNPSHTYTASGTYPVTLTVTDRGNRTDTKSLQVTVREAPPPAPAGVAETVAVAAVLGVGGAAVVGYVLVQRRRRGPR